MKLNLEEYKELLEKALEKKEIYNTDLNEIKEGLSRIFDKSYKEYNKDLSNDEVSFNRNEVSYIRTKYITIKGPKELYNKYSKNKKYNNEYEYLKPWIDQYLPIFELFERVKTKCQIIKGRKIDPEKQNLDKIYRYSKESEELTKKIFSEISEPVYDYLKNMFNKQYKGVCKIFESSGHKSIYEFYKETPEVFKNYYYSIIKELYDDEGNKIKNFKTKLEKLCDIKAKRVIDNYVNKNVDKVAYIIDNKQLENYVVSELEYQTGMIKSDIHFSFNDDTSFNFSTSIKYNTSKYGMEFVQYPARFYDVISKNEIDKPSEEKMKTIFLQNDNTLKM